MDPGNSKFFESPDTDSFVLSTTVSGVISSFPEGEPISAMDFAEAILKRHPEYGKISKVAK